MISVFGREIDGGILLNICLGGESRTIYHNDEERRLVANKRHFDRYHNCPERREYLRQWERDNRERYKERRNELTEKNIVTTQKSIKEKEKHIMKETKKD